MYKGRLPIFTALLVYWVQPLAARAASGEGGAASPMGPSAMPRQKLEIQPCPQDGFGPEAMLRGRLRSGPAALGYLSRVDAMRDAMCTGLALKREDRRKTSRGLP